MASAAAVAADSMESPLDETSADGVFSGSVHPNDLAAAGSDDESADSRGVNGETAVTQDDLFGDEDDDDDNDANEPSRPRLLDDEELDSGDDEDRADRRPGEEEDVGQEQKTLTLLDVELPRTAIPRGSDGELYMLKMPDFLEIDPKAFSLSSFRPPTTDHHRKGDPSTTFSAYGTAMTTIRWRRSPSKPTELQSNARILRWSDGSLTLQLASDPLTQYELPPNSLATPQVNPPKPTPTSVVDRRNRAHRRPYNPKLDGFTYLAIPDAQNGIMRVTNKITAGLQVESADSGGTDEALEKLQESVADQQRRREEAYSVSSTNVIMGDGDPEMAKKRAEAAEKEKMRAQRRLENQMNRDRERRSGVLGRAGVRAGGGGGGLTVDDLEGAGGRSAGGRPSKPKKRRQLRDEYSDEDDYMGRRRTREDEYDMEDEFMAEDDEEEAADEEDDIDAEIERQERRRAERAGSGTPKRGRAEDDDDDDDAEGEDDDVPAAANAAVGAAPDSPKQVKRRRVIDDDDDEDE